MLGILFTVARFSVRLPRKIFPFFPYFFSRKTRGSSSWKRKRKRENPWWQKHLQFSAGFDKVKLLHTLIFNMMLSLNFFSFCGETQWLLFCDQVAHGNFFFFFWWLLFALEMKEGGRLLLFFLLFPWRQKLSLLPS